MVVGMCALVLVPHCVVPALLELLMMAIEHGICRFRVRVKNHTRAMQRSPYCVAKRNRCNINAESIYIGLPVAPTTSATLQIIKPMIVSVVVINTSFPLFLLLGERRPQDSCLCLASAFSQMGSFHHASSCGLHHFVPRSKCVDTTLSSKPLLLQGAGWLLRAQRTDGLPRVGVSCCRGQGGPKVSPSIFMANPGMKAFCCSLGDAFDILPVARPNMPESTDQMRW